MNKCGCEGQEPVGMRGDVGPCDRSKKFGDGVKNLTDEYDQTEPILQPHENKPKKKNLVLDYRTLRKSGYFLEKTPKNLDYAPTLSTTDKVTSVVQWLNSSDNDPTHLTNLDEPDPGVDIDGVKRSQLLNRFSSEEDRFKRLVLGEGSNEGISFTSEPAKTLTYQQLDKILEAANKHVDDFLEEARGHMERQPEQAYVSGTVAFPESWRSKSSGSFKGTGSFYNWLKGWFYSNEFSQNAMGPVDTPSREFRSGQLILEPYHGPTSINGAAITAGSTGNNEGGVSLSGKIVEEVKAVLRAIHWALKKVHTQSDPTSILSTKAMPSNEDTEISKLTELLQNALLEKKSTLKRTVFVLKNSPESITPISRSGRNASLIRPPLPLGRRRKTIFSRTVSGMIQRAPTHRPRYRIIRDDGGLAYVRANRVSPDGPAIPSHPTSNSGNFIAGLKSFVRLIAPFQIPAPVPAPPYVPANDEDFVMVNVPQQQQFRLDDISRLHLRPYQSQTLRKGQKKSSKNRLHKIGRY